MAKRRKPKRLYLSVTEDTYAKFKKLCEEKDITIQKQLESIFELWLETEVK